MTTKTPLIDKRLEELERMDQPVLVKHLPRKKWDNRLITGKILLWQVSRSTASILYELVKAHHPKTILELGTSGGYSTLWMVKALHGTEHRIDTIEFSTYRFDIANQSFATTGTQSIITQHQSKTHDILDKWTRPIDMLFIDHGKEHYLADLKRIEHLLSPNAVIIADNILDNPCKVSDFVTYLKQNPKYDTHIIKMDNGLLLAYRTSDTIFYESIQTGDGSMTFLNTAIDETYHSKSGAFEEALEKHVRPSQLLDKATKTDHLAIADICFGLGYNSLVALRELFRQGFDKRVELLAFENDTSLMKHSKGFDFGHDVRNESTIIRSLLDNPYSYSDNATQAKTLVGDIRKTILTVADDTFDVVFFDPFSPKKHPHLWSEELFQQVYRVMKRNAVLTTYSCARIVRNNLRKAGFIVEDGPAVGRRSPSTIARKK